MFVLAHSRQDISSLSKMVEVPRVELGSAKVPLLILRSFVVSWLHLHLGNDTLVDDLEYYFAIGIIPALNRFPISLVVVPSQSERMKGWDGNYAARRTSV